MNIIASHSYPVEVAEELSRIVDLKIFPSRNAVVRAGIDRILEEFKQGKLKPENKPSKQGV